MSSLGSRCGNSFRKKFVQKEVRSEAEALAGYSGYGQEGFEASVTRNGRRMNIEDRRNDPR